MQYSQATAALGSHTRPMFGKSGTTATISAEEVSATRCGATRRAQRAARSVQRAACTARSAARACDLHQTMYHDVVQALLVRRSAMFAVLIGWILTLIHLLTTRPVSAHTAQHAQHIISA